MSNFGSGTPSGPLHFMGGNVNLVGKFFNGDVVIEGCASANVQNCDFNDGFGLIMDRCYGKPTIAHNRSRNPGVNFMKVTNSFFDANSNIVHNVARGRSAVTEDYFLFQNTGGVSSAGPLRIEYNRSDGRDPITRALPTYSVPRGSHIRYGGMTESGSGNTSLVYNTCFCPGPFAIDVDSGAHVILYYNILIGLKLPGSIAALRLFAAPGTIGNGGVPLEVSVDDIFWQDENGIDTRYSTDRSLQEVYLSEVSMAIDLNAVG